MSSTNFCLLPKLHVRRMEKNREFGIRNLKPTNANDVRTYKVREGKIGGHKQHLSPEDIKYIDKTEFRKIMDKAEEVGRIVGGLRVSVDKQRKAKSELRTKR